MLANVILFFAQSSYLNWGKRQNGDNKCMLRVRSTSRTTVCRREGALTEPKMVKGRSGVVPVLA